MDKITNITSTDHVRRLFGANGARKTRDGRAALIGGFEPDSVSISKEAAAFSRAVASVKEQITAPGNDEERARVLEAAERVRGGVYYVDTSNIAESILSVYN